MSYLKYIDGFTQEKYQLVRTKSGISIAKLAMQTGISKYTLSNWAAKSGRPPNPLTWKLFIYEMEANRIGYKSVQNLLESID